MGLDKTDNNPMVPYGTKTPCMHDDDDDDDEIAIKDINIAIV
jgi:hypothetical protein